MGIIRYNEFLSLTGSDVDATPPDPYFTVGKNPSEEIELDWLNTAKDSCWDTNRERANKQITVAALCRGRYYENQDAYLDYREPQTLRYQKTTKVTVPEHHRYVNTLSARLSKFQPGIQVGPYTNEFMDKEAARVGQKVYDSLEYALNITKLKRRVVKKAIKFGEQFAWIRWDKDIGPVDPEWKKEQKKYGDKKTKLRNKKTGKEWEYDPDKPRRSGWFRVDLPLPWNTLLDPKDCPEKVDWIIIIEPQVHIRLLQSRYPKKKNALELKASNGDGYESVTYDNHYDVMHFYHRSTKEVPKGKHIVFLDDIILEKGDNEMHGIEALCDSEWGDLPVERMVDIDLDGELHGFSSLYLVHNLIHAKNSVLASIYRNFRLAGHPKWLVHRTAKIRRESLGNDATIVEWNGNIAPTLAQMATIPPGMVELYNILTQESDKVMNVHPVSSGTPPSGIKAGVAIRLLEEIEEANLTNLIDNLGNFSLALARRLLSVAGMNMDKGAHLIRIVGEDDSDIVEEFDPQLLTQPFNYKLEKINNMARSPAARMQQIIDLVEVVKDGATQEQILDAMDLIQPEKITDPAVSAVSLAEYENEFCAQNKEMPKPREGERLLVHWNVHMAFYQRRGFTMLPDSAKERFRTHLLATEFLMSELAAINPMFEQQALSLPGYPAFYHLPPDQLAKRKMLIGAPQEGPPPMGSPDLAAPDEKMMPHTPLSNEQISEGRV